MVVVVVLERVEDYQGAWVIVEECSCAALDTDQAEKGPGTRSDTAEVEDFDTVVKTLDQGEAGTAVEVQMPAD
jgi:hypothetical protein